MHRLRKIPPEGPTPNDTPSSESHVGMVEKHLPGHIAQCHKIMHRKLLWAEVR